MLLITMVPSVSLLGKFRFNWWNLWVCQSFSLCSTTRCWPRLRNYEKVTSAQSFNCTSSFRMQRYTIKSIKSTFFMCRHQRVIPNGWRELKRRNGSTSTLVIARFLVILYFVLTFDVCDTFRYNAHRDNCQMNTRFERRFCAERWGCLLNTTWKCGYTLN